MMRLVPSVTNPKPRARVYAEEREHRQERGQQPQQEEEEGAILWLNSGKKNKYGEHLRQTAIYSSLMNHYELNVESMSSWYFRKWFFF